MSEIRVFHTHIEVYPYVKGDCPVIEKMMSKYVMVSLYNNYRKLVPFAYHIEDDTLYLPRGINTSLLESFFQSTPMIVTKHDKYEKIKTGEAKLPPKSKIQNDGINFLCGQEDYKYTLRYSQLGLNLDTGDGKTYATITAILKLKIKSIIITHQEKIKQQWINSIKELTTFPDECICNISGTKVIDEIMNGNVDGEIYLVNHQTIKAYAKMHGWKSIKSFFKKIKVGIKVFDEAHKFFENIFMVDNFSNCYKTFYLTATFGRSDPSELSVYKKAFASLTRFGEETFNYEGKRKHINFIIVYFKSEPMYGVLPNLKSQKGFSTYKYIDYELNEENQSLLKVLSYILEKTSQLEGKTLIISPKKDSVRYIADFVSQKYHCDVGKIYSDSEDEDFIQEGLVKFISSTVKSVGEGADIKDLRVLINLEPIGSKDLADQVRGRLREYDDDKETYFFYPVDTRIPDSTKMLKRILPVMQKKCKSVIKIKL